MVAAAAAVGMKTKGGSSVIKDPKPTFPCIKSLIDREAAGPSPPSPLLSKEAISS